MELLFVVLGGAILGLAARYSLPRRHDVRHAPSCPRSAPASPPSSGSALTWLGWAWDGGWIWVVSFVAAGLAAVASAWFIGPRRERSDAALFERLAAGARAAPDATASGG